MRGLDKAPVRRQAEARRRLMPDSHNRRRKFRATWRVGAWRTKEAPGGSRRRVEPFDSWAHEFQQSHASVVERVAGFGIGGGVVWAGKCDGAAISATAIGRVWENLALGAGRGHGRGLVPPLARPALRSSAIGCGHRPTRPPGTYIPLRSVKIQL